MPGLRRRCDEREVQINLNNLDPNDLTFVDNYQNLPQSTVLAIAEAKEIGQYI